MATQLHLISPDWDSINSALSEATEKTGIAIELQSPNLYRVTLPDGEDAQLLYNSADVEVLTDAVA